MQTSSAVTSANRNIIKTIYDPSPVGFKVPPKWAFDPISENRVWTNGTSNNVGGLIYSTEEGDLFFPALGAAWVFERSLYTPGFVGQHGFYWSASSYSITSYDNTNAYPFSFTTGGTHPGVGSGFTFQNWREAYSVRPIQD